MGNQFNGMAEDNMEKAPKAYSWEISAVGEKKKKERKILRVENFYNTRQNKHLLFSSENTINLIFFLRIF